MNNAEPAWLAVPVFYTLDDAEAPLPDMSLTNLTVPHCYFTCYANNIELLIHFQFYLWTLTLECSSFVSLAVDRRSTGSYPDLEI